MKYYIKIANKIPFDILSISILSVIYIILLYYFSSFKFHYQEDEFLTAYISYFLPSINKIEWFSLYPLDNSWVTQFPILFFIIQKPFFLLFGPTLEAIRISVFPYHVLSVILIWLIAKEYFEDKIYHFLVSFIFILLAPNLYLSSLGLHFITSTVFFLTSFYFFLLVVKKPTSFNSIMLGIFLGFSYLTYASSYITLPLLIIFFLLKSISDKTWRYFSYFRVSLIIFLLIMSPFYKFILEKNNFLNQRVNQVSALNLQNPTINLEYNFFSSFVYNFKSLFIAKMGGVNEYYFGNLELFNMFTFIFIIVGAVIFSIYSLQKRIKFVFPIISIIVVFILGMVLTVPQGAFHRIYIIFPFIALTIVGGLEFILRKLQSRFYRLYFVVLFIMLFSTSNLFSVHKMIKEDSKISILTDSLYIHEFIENNVMKGKTIFISAYPAYHLGKELFFRTNNTYNIKTNYFPNQISSIKKGDILILHYPQDREINELINKFPNGSIIKTLGEYSLKYHNIFINN